MFECIRSFLVLHFVLLSFFIVWLCINHVCSIPEIILDFPRESAEKVSQICHSIRAAGKKVPSFP